MSVNVTLSPCQYRAVGNKAPTHTNHESKITTPTPSYPTTTTKNAYSYDGSNLGARTKNGDDDASHSSTSTPKHESIGTMPMDGDSSLQGLRMKKTPAYSTSSMEGTQKPLRKRAPCPYH